MIYSIRCPSCKKELDIPEEYMNNSGNCKHCNFTFIPNKFRTDVNKLIKEPPWFYWLIGLFIPFVGIIIGIFIDNTIYKKRTYLTFVISWFIFSTFISISGIKEINKEIDRSNRELQYEVNQLQKQIELNEQIQEDNSKYIELNEYPTKPIIENNIRNNIKPEVSNKITLQQFNRIRAGMTYNQVKNILGRDGVCEFSYHSELIGNSSTFSWENEGLFEGRISIGFDNGRVTSKHQFGLEN